MGISKQKPVARVGHDVHNEALKPQPTAANSKYGCQPLNKWELNIVDLATWLSERVSRHAKVAVAILGMRRKLV